MWAPLLTAAVLRVFGPADGGDRAGPLVPADAGAPADAASPEPTTSPGSTADAGQEGGPELLVQGNWVLPEEIYRALVDFAPGARADEATAQAVAARVLQFLRRSGYELAAVAARPVGDAVELSVNEGRLEKVVFRGKLTVQTLRFKLGLNLPHEVFNRPLLERELRRLCQETGIPRAWYELVPTHAVPHTGPQLEHLAPIKGFALVQPLQPYELHLFFAENEWDTGVGLDLRSGYPDGLELGVNYQGRGALFSDDRWRAAASGGGQLRRSILADRLYGAPSRVFAEGLWYAPQLVTRMTRPFVWLRGEGISRQRLDLRLENYYYAEADGSLNLQYEFAEGLTASLGVGFQYRALTGFRPVDDDALARPTVQRYRTFGLLRTNLIFEPEAERWDRRHQLLAEGRHFFAWRDPDYGEAKVEYQKVLAWGWHDLWLRARGSWMWGEVLFHNEEPLGRHLRGIFGNIYARRLASVSTEFRFSVTRDLFKVSLFHEAAAYGDIDRATGHDRLRLANAFGPGFHALIEGMLQFDLYASFGFTSDNRFDGGVAAMLLKVF